MMCRAFRSVQVTVLAMVVSGACATLHAQTQSCSAGNGVGSACNRTFNLSLTVVKVTSMTVSPATGFSLVPASGSVSNAEYNAGFYDVASPMSVTISSNGTWNATITATSPTFTAPCGTKPAGDLLWGRTSTTRTTPLATTATPLLASTSNAAVAGLVTTLFFRVNNVTWTSAPPGTCSVPFTIAVQ